MAEDTAPLTVGDVEAQDSVKVQQFLSDSAWSNASSTWINNHVRNSPIAQSVEAWNHLGLILPKLRALLELELKK